MTQKDKNKMFYDCPIIAAYMAQYFNVKITSQPKGGLIFPDGTQKDPNAFMRVYLSHIDEFLCDKFYIHQESYSVFEPKEGDLVYFSDIEEYLFYQKSDGDAWVKEIIQRNGIAFMMPKTE